MSCPAAESVSRDSIFRAETSQVIPGRDRKKISPDNGTGWLGESICGLSDICRNFCKTLELLQEIRNLRNGWRNGDGSIKDALGFVVVLLE